jgi:hypothetical protein
VSTRGVRFLSRQPVIGADWYHGASDRREALAQLRGDFDHLRGELGSAPSAIATALAPTLEAFDAFYDAETESTLAPWITEWSVFEAWKERIAWARMAARAAGVALTSPEPANLPKTTWERGQDGTGTGTDRAFVFGRDVVKLGLGIAAVVAVWKFGRRVWRVLEVEREAIVDLAEDAEAHEDGAMHHGRYYRGARHPSSQSSSRVDDARHHADAEIQDAELVE